jgi:hypothetical protein
VRIAGVTYAQTRQVTAPGPRHLHFKQRSSCGSRLMIYAAAFLSADGPRFEMGGGCIYEPGM